MTLDTLPEYLRRPGNTEEDSSEWFGDGLSIKQAQKTIERILISRALKKTDGNRSAAARIRVALRTKSGSSRQDSKANCPNPVRSIRFKCFAGMIWSVSTSARFSGIDLPVTTVNFSINRLLTPGPNVDEMAGNCGRGSHLGANEMSAPPRSLAALEVSV